MIMYCSLLLQSNQELYYLLLSYKSNEIETINIKEMNYMSMKKQSVFKLYKNDIERLHIIQGRLTVLKNKKITQPEMISLMIKNFERQLDEMERDNWK